MKRTPGSEPTVVFADAATCSPRNRTAAEFIPSTRRALPSAVRAVSRFAGVAALALAVGDAQAATFDLGPFEAKLISRLSAGASWRTEDPSSRVVSPGNTDGTGRASASTTDDGNLNYGKGSMYSLLFRGLHDLDLNAGNWGFFTRLKWWYDYEQANVHEREAR